MIAIKLNSSPRSHLKLFQTKLMSWLKSSRVLWLVLCKEEPVSSSRTLLNILPSIKSVTLSLERQIESVFTSIPSLPKSPKPFITMLCNGDFLTPIVPLLLGKTVHAMASQWNALTLGTTLMANVFNSDTPVAAEDSFVKEAAGSTRWCSFSRER